MKLPHDHIWVLLIAFLSVLGCFTAITVIGTVDSCALAETIIKDSRMAWLAGGSGLIQVDIKQAGAKRG